MSLAPEFQPMCPICRTRPMIVTLRVKSILIVVCEGCDSTLNVPIAAIGLRQEPLPWNGIDRRRST